MLSQSIKFSGLLLILVCGVALPTQILGQTLDVAVVPDQQFYCPGESITLQPVVSDIPQGPGFYQWNLDGLSTFQNTGGTLSELEDLNDIVLDAPGTFDVTLQLDISALDTTLYATTTIFVGGTVDPEISLANTDIDFGMSSANGFTTFTFCGGLESATFEFAVDYVIPLDTLVSEIEWDWGDGSMATTEEAASGSLMHEYNPGQYTITVTTTSEFGCETTATYGVFVGTAPLITVTSAGEEICLPGQHQLTIESNGALVDYDVFYSDDYFNVTSFSASVDTTLYHPFTTTSCGQEIDVSPTQTIQNAFEAIVVAENACSANNIPTIFTVIPIIVSKGPELEITSDVGGAICPGFPATVTNTTDEPELVDNGGCTNEYAFYWELEDGLILESGNLGSNEGWVGAEYNPELWLTGSEEIVVTSNDLGSYMVTLYSGTVCGFDSVSWELNVLSPGTVAVNPSSQTLCSGFETSDFTFTADPSDYQISWTVLDEDMNEVDPGEIMGVDSVMGAEIGTSTPPSWLPINTGSDNLTFFISANVPCPSSPPVVHQITVEPEPVITATPQDTTICNGTTTDIVLDINLVDLDIIWTVDPGMNISGTPGPDHEVFIQDTWFNSGSELDSVVYELNAENPVCPGDTTIITVYVLPGVPTLTKLDLVLCPEDVVDSIPMPEIEGIVWTWENSNTDVGLGAFGEGTIPEWTAGSNVTPDNITSVVTVTGQVEECEPVVAETYNVTLRPEPVIEADPFLSTQCSGVATDIELSVNTGENIVWDFIQGPNVSGAMAGGPGTQISDVLVNTGTFADTVVYNLTIDNPICPGEPTFVAVEVLPQLPEVTLNDVEACPGDLVDGQTLPSVNGVNWTWENSNDNVGLASNGTGNLPNWTATNTSSQLETATVVLTGQIEGCPEQDVGTIEIAVNPLPFIETTVEPNGGLSCADGQADITFFQITPNTSVEAITGPSVVSFDATGGVVDAAGTYFVDLVSDASCNATISFVVMEPQAIELLTVAFSDPLCAGQNSGIIEVTTDADEVSYSWTPNVSDGPVANMLSAGAYSLVVTNESQCQDSTAVVLNEPDAITISLVDSLVSECGEANGMLEVWATGGSGSLSYEWSNGDDGVTAEEIDEGIYTVTIEDGNGCTVDSSFVLPCTELIQPEADEFLSPNGDGQNERWIIDNIVYYPEATVQVFNRWGVEVFRADPPYQNTWDGKNADGTSLPSATYFYVIDTKKKSQKPFRGYIEIQTETP